MLPKKINTLFPILILFGIFALMFQLTANHNRVLAENNLEFTATVDTAYFNEDASVSLAANQKSVFFDFVLQGQDTLITSPFTFDGFNTRVTMNRLLYSTTSKPRITIHRQHSRFPGYWETVKIVTTADSIETVQQVADTLSPGWHRYIILGTASNPSDTWGKIAIDGINN